MTGGGADVTTETADPLVTMCMEPIQALRRMVGNLAEGTAYDGQLGQETWAIEQEAALRIELALAKARLEAWEALHDTMRDQVFAARHTRRTVMYSNKTWIAIDGRIEKEQQKIAALEARLAESAR